LFYLSAFLEAARRDYYEVLPGVRCVRLGMTGSNTSCQAWRECRQIEAGFPIQHISDWQAGAWLSVKDPALLLALRESELIIFGIDRATIPMHADELTRESQSHAKA
jgi:hypothetical protein